MPMRSCMAQLLSVMDDWTDALEGGYAIDVIYLGTSEGF